MKPALKRKLRRTISATLATLLATGLVAPALAARYSGAEVYDHVLEMREEHFQNSIRFNEDGTANISGDEWYDQSEVIGINRERAKSQFISYQDTATALAAEKSVLDDVGPETSDYYMLLSGKDWDFALVKTPEEAKKVDETYLAKDYTGDAFQPEYVPQAWQTYRNEDGTFKYDEPMYTNHALPWFSNFEPVNYGDPHAPTVYNPVGYYRTSFEVPENWDGRDVFISFQSVESAYYLYVNGQKVGYSTDAFTAHDFNITPYLTEGENTIALKVFRWSIGSWLENQDFIRQSGIYRDVYLYSKDEAEIRDFFVKTQFDDRTSEDSDVAVTVETDVRALHNEQAGTYTISSYIVDNSGETVATADNQTVELKAAGSYEDKLSDAGTTVTSTMKVTNPAKWFPDTPNLYSLVLELKDADGNVMESVVERIGFREIYKVDIDDQGHEQMQITGRQVVLRGVNRHDTNLETGHALTFQDYLTDLTLMKEHNLNAIRTSHYPNDKALYDLADELGLYVCAEANIESHRAAMQGVKVPTGTGQGMPEWVATVTDRVVTNLEMYKNNPSVIMWSLGNEATYSYAPLNEDYGFWVASMYLLKRDPSRLRKYERESENYQHPYVKQNGQDPWSTDVRKNNIVDVHSTQYVLPNYVASYNGRMPLIHSEYNHAMGLSYGNAMEHWDAIRENDQAQGGFIWDYIDQSIRTVRDNGDGTYDEFWGYGGDWIDPNANDDAFCGNGMLFADRTPTPKMTEAKKVHQQVNFYLDDQTVTSGQDVTLKVVNEYENTTLDAFDITWKLTKDGLTELGSGTLDLNTPNMDGQSLMSGQQVENVAITLPEFEAVEGSDYLLDISVTLKNATNWAEAGYEVAYEQFQLNPDDAQATETQVPDKAFESVEELGSQMTLTGTTDNGQKFEIVLDTESGTIVSYSLDGNVVMTQGPEQSLYRAETYNDTTVAKNANLKNAGATENLSNLEVSVNTSENKVLMAMNGAMKVSASALMAYEIYGNGEIVVLSQFIPTSNFAPNGLPKIGGRMLINGDYDNLTFYGRGPDENYVDRKSGSTVGVYTSKVYDPDDAMGENSNWDGKRMLKPQENGSRSDIRWTALTNDQGVGLMVTGDGLLESSVSHYTAEDMNSGTYNSATYRHPNQVPQRQEIVWNIDLHQNGVSDTAFMGHKPLDGYFFPTNQSYSYSYRISPVSTNDVGQLMDKSNEGFKVPTSSYPITGIYINDNAVAGFDVNSETGASYTLAANESIESVTVDGTNDFTVTYNEDGTLTVSATNSYGQEFNYVVKLGREGKELGRDVLSKVKVDNYYSGQPGSNMIDGNNNSIWHSNWSITTPMNKLWFMVELKDETAINGIRYLPRQDSTNLNGAYGQHEIYVSSKPIDQLTSDVSSGDWTKVATGSWPKTKDWKSTAFGEMVNAKTVMVVPKTTYGDTENAWGSGAEFRVTAGTVINTADVTVNLEDSYTYKGEAVRPAPEVKLGDQTLIRGVDYTVDYTDNEAVGTGKLTINFCGAFAGDAIEKEFNIVEGQQRTLTLTLGDRTTQEQVYVGQTITLEAGEAPENKMFDHWSADNDGVKFADANSETTTFVMPDADVTVTANYVDAYTVTVVNGYLDEDGTITSQKYKVGSSVVFYADIPEGKVFDVWTIDSEDASITDPARNPGLMNSTPAHDIVVTANFKTDPNYFAVLDTLPDHHYLGTTFTAPETLRIVQGDQESNAAVTWNEAQVKAIQDATSVCTLPLTGTVADHEISTTVAVVPGNVVYFVDNGSEAFSQLAQTILKYNADTVRNTTPDQFYDAESGWGCTNPESEVETHNDYGTDAYSTIRNMTDTKGEDPNDGRGKPLIYQFDNLEAGTYQVFVGYKNIWYQTTWQRNATIELLQGDSVLASVEKNLNVEKGQFVQMEMEVTEAGSVELKMTPKENANANNDMLVSYILITKDGEVVEPEEYTVTVNTQGEGTAAAEPTTATAGTTVTLTEQAAEGWHFVEWQSEDVTVTDNTFVMPEGNVTVTAVFEKDAAPGEVNKTLLEKTVKYAETLSTEGVTDTAKKAFEDALANAKAVLDDKNATQEQVNDAWDNLLNGIWGLGLTQGDKTVLNLVIQRAEAMMDEADKYVEANWQQLVDTLKTAQDVAADGDAMQEDVDNATDALLDAILAQRYKADKSILEDLLNQAEGMDLSGYTEESVAAFRTALAAAQAVMADATLSEDDQAKVDDAVAALRSAMEGLTAEGETQPSDKPEVSDKPETTDQPEATDKPEGTQKPDATEKPDTEGPAQTGDSAQLMLYVAALAAAVAVLGAVTVMRRRRSH